MHPTNMKLFLKSNTPSNVLNRMLSFGVLDHEVADLVYIPQDVAHHPEGSAYIHTCMTVDIAAEISSRENLEAFDNAVLRLAMLCHDMGKVTNTQIYEDGRITAYGHPEAGIAPANDFLLRNKINYTVIEHVLPLVALHMAHIGFYTSDITSKSVRKLIKKLEPTNLQMLAYVIEADASGRGGKYYRQGLPARMKQILDVAATLDNPVDVYPDPLLSGDDIMRLFDIAPSKALGEIKAALYKAQLEGKFNTKIDAIAYAQQHIIIKKEGQ